jgi:methylmalonyl-CoA mutase N-terminal domain/subunit
MFEGFSSGIEEDYLQGRITDSAYDLERRFNNDQSNVVGVSHFLNGNDDED